MSSRHCQLGLSPGSCRRRRRQLSMQVRVCSCKPCIYRILSLGGSLNHVKLVTGGIAGVIYMGYFYRFCFST